MVSPGTFVLHDAVRPALPDGAYQLQVTQQLDPPGQSVDALDKYLAVTGPRFTLPPDQPLSVYPPADATGAFSTRLPQIVLRRRTLPWERYIDPGEPDLPWLALVVLADGEGQLTTNQPVDSTGLPDPDLRDSDTRDVLTVTERVVQQIFPTKQDLPWLCHAREVDLADTELALGDDDGWMAVVLANRLPQPGLQYTACLVSLEGHGGDLPAKESSANSFSGLTVYTQAEISQAAVLQRQSETAVDAAGTQPAGTGPAAATQAAAQQTGQAAPATLVGFRPAATKPAAPADAWSAPALTAAVAAGQQASTTARGFITGTSSVTGLSINPVFLDPEARLVEFTVLKHWSFTCSDGGDFESLMLGLDDGMLGTLPPPPPPPATAGTPPGDPAARPDPVITDTGHVQMAAISRRGDPGKAWYRGPFSPRQILRAEPGESGSLPLLHAADQARRVGPDGLEDLSLAAAFEIGRLLAAAQPAVVAGLLGWRQGGYAPSRVRSVLSRAGRPARPPAPGPQPGPGRVQRRCGGHPARLAREQRRAAARPGPPAGQSGPGSRRARQQPGRGGRAGVRDGSRRGVLGPEPGARGGRPGPGGHRAGAARAAGRARPGGFRLGAGRAGRAGELAGRPVQAPRRGGSAVKVTLTQADALAVGWEAKQFLTLPPAQGGVSLLPGGVSDWLAALRLAEGVPFQYLVADDRLLPPESIRFFYLDRNWTDALVAGALSVGAITTDDRAQLQVLYPQIRDELDADERLVRVPGNEVAVSGPADVVTGVLIRSRAVSGWPAMHVRAYRDEVPDDGSDDDPSRLHLMRLERLAPAVLLALFDGVPAVVHIEEPRSGLQFGFELTDPQPQGAIAYDLPLRAPGTRNRDRRHRPGAVPAERAGGRGPGRPAAAGPGPGRGHRKRRRVRARGPPVPLPPGVRTQPGRSRPGLLRPVPAGRRHHRDADLAGVRGGHRQCGRRRR